METASLLSDPDTVINSMTGIRRQILEALDEPSSATGIAERLGTSRQRVNYHVRALEDAGLVELVAERRRRGFTERVVQRTGDVVVVDPSVFSDLRLGQKEAAGLTGLISAASDVIRNAAKVANEASDEGSYLVTATLDTNIRLESPEALRDLVDELGALLARYDSQQGLMLRITTMALPTHEDH